MKTVSAWFYRQVAIGLVLLLAAQFGLSAAAQELPPPQQPAPIQSPASANPANDAPQIASLPDSPAPITPQTAPAIPQESSSQTPPQQQQTTPAQPLGTAAAPSEPASGVAASRPAGAAIAPAKQKRSRTFAIRIALIVGAAVAVGTVVALSSASPSRP